MLIKIVSVLALALALVGAVAPDPVPAYVIPAIVVLGLIYGGIAIDAENATDYLVVVLVVSAAAMTEVLLHLPFIGVYMNAMLHNVATGLLASGVTVLAGRMMHRLMRKR